MGLLDRLRTRRKELPAGVSGHLGLQAGEAVLAAAQLDDGSTAVATSLRLVVADRGHRHLDVAWHEVDTAGWDPDTGQLLVRLVDGRHLRLEMTGDGRTMLPEVVRERVQSSVVVSQKVVVRGRRGVRVVVRRTPAGLVTQVLADAGIDLQDARVTAEVARTRQELMRAAGMDRPGGPG